MIKEIKYTGFSASPSDYECPDGELAAVLDAVSEDGSIRPLFPPNVLFTLGEGQSVMFIHKTIDFVHYVILDSANNTLSWRTMEDDDLHLLNTFGSIRVRSVNAVGNTLVTLCPDGIHYFLWKADNNAYTYLGNEMPECPISFGLKGESRLYSKLKGTDENAYGTFTISFNSIAENKLYEEFTEENKQKITSQVLAKVNKFINEIATEKGKFIYPFFVRYAYRLYDGSLSHHSAPILMIPSTKGNPLILWKHIYGKGSYKEAELDIFSIACTLDYQPLSYNSLQQLSLWSDIIKSVDIFISSPIYTYDQNGLCESFKETENLSGFFVGKFQGGDRDGNWSLAVNGEVIKYYQKWLFSQVYSFTHEGSYPSYCLDIPQYSEAKIARDIKDCHTFYFIRSIPVQDLTTARKDIVIEEDYLKSLVAKEVMTDDYQTHDRLIPSYSYAYNSRLNIANIRRRLFRGYDTAAMVCYTNGFMNYWSTKTGNDSIEQHTNDMSLSYNAVIYTNIQTDGRNIVLCNNCSVPLSYDRGHYLFYPDTSATSMVISSFMHTRRAKLEPHTGLNGSFYFDGFNVPTDGASIPIVTREPIISLPNKIYTSGVNNPFYFPLSGINTIGTGDILGICSAVKALSEGQFGQFPLYAFSTEGVWALEVSDTGGYSTKQPVTRDVCLNPSSITQIDSAVLFATARGIMLLSGSTNQCISEILDGEPFGVSNLPSIQKLIALTGLNLDSFAYVDFKRYIKNCRIAYDYINQRIVVFNPDYPYAYSYSMKSKLWGMMSSVLSETVNSYPEAYAMTGDYRFVSLSDYDTRYNDDSLIGLYTNPETGKISFYGVNAVLVTRPLKLDAPDMLKTISSVIQRGVFQKGHVAQILYGSRNLIDWFAIASGTDHYLRGFSGTPYKYFRLVIICALKPNECLFGCSVQYEPRFTNNLR